MSRWLSPEWVVTSWVREDWFGGGESSPRWISPSWVTTSWIAPSWFGGGESPSPGNWLGNNWLRPGWVNRAYLTNVGTEPTSRFVGDTLSVSLKEEASYSVRIRIADTLSLSLEESFNTTYTRHIVAFESINLSIGEQQLSLLKSSLEDDLDLNLDEVVESGEGEFSVISASDTLDIEVDDPGIQQAIETGELLDTSIGETSTTGIFLFREDSLDLDFDETSQRSISGAISVNAFDSLNLSLGESVDRHIFKSIEATDTLNLDLSGSASVELGVILTYLQSSDSLDFSLAENSVKSGEVDTVAKTGEDSLDLSLEETSSKVGISFLSVNDNLLVQVIGNTQIQKISIQQTWEDAQYPWGGSTLRDIKPLPVFAYDFDFYQVDSADTFITPNGWEGIPVVLERLGLTIYGRDRQGNWKEDPDIVKLVKGLYPIFRGEPGTVINIYVGAQETMEGPVSWDGPHPFIIGEDTSINPLVSGPFIAVRFESTGQKPWKLLSYTLDITQVGRRN